MSTPATVEPFHNVGPVGNNDVHQVKYCQGGCKPQSITPKLPAQRKLFHTVNIFGLNKHFLPQQAGGIPFRAGNDTIFVAEPRRRTQLRRNATCGTNIWWRAWKRLPKKEICAKVFLFLESAIFEKRNGGKFTLLWSCRMLGADPPVRRPASPHTSRAAATLYVRGLWGTTLSLRGRVVQRFPGCSRMRRMLLLPKWLIQ